VAWDGVRKEVEVLVSHHVFVVVPAFAEAVRVVP
jgi:hypothetical protein